MMVAAIDSLVVVGLNVGPADTDTGHGNVVVRASGGSCAYAEPHGALTWQNHSLLRTIREIDRRRSNMRLTAGDGSEDLLREARDGGMYGIDCRQ